MSPAPRVPMTRGERLALLLPYLIGLILVAAAVWVAGEEIHRHIRDFDGWIASLGPWAIVVFVLLYAVLTSLFVPDLLLGFAAGASFGLSQGILAAAGGSLLGAMLQFALAHRLLKRPIERLVARRPAMPGVLRAVKHDELKLQLLIRLTPINRAFTSYMLGAIGVRFGWFVLACVAIVPSLAIEVSTGVAGKHFTAMAARSAHGISTHDVFIVVGLLTALAVVVSVSHIARRALEDAAARESGETLVAERA